MLDAHINGFRERSEIHARKKIIGKMALDISTSKHPSQIPLALEFKKRRHGRSIVNGFAKPNRGNLTFKSWS